MWFTRLIMVSLLVFTAVEAKADTVMTYNGLVVSYPDTCAWQNSTIKCYTDEDILSASFRWFSVDAGDKFVQSRQLKAKNDPKWKQEIIDAMNTRLIETVPDDARITDYGTGMYVNPYDIVMTIGIASTISSDGRNIALYLVQVWKDGTNGELIIITENYEANRNNIALILDRIRKE